MRIAYLDCFSGIAGDMLLGALVDAGLDADALRAEIAKLKLEGVELRTEPAKRKGITGTNVTVEVAHDHHHRSLSTIERIIGDSALDDRVKQRAVEIFRRLGEAEATVHGVDIEKVHFHEVGALDAIVDIVGASAGLFLLGVDEVHCSPLNLGSGTVKAAHGVMPVPAPATARLVADIPTYSAGPAVELTTPTGAAIAATLSKSFGPMPPLRISATGYGAGDRDLDDRANMLRVVLGDSTQAAAEPTEVFVIEANLDDMTPEAAGFARERLLAAGALDVTLAPIYMKKDRPGFQLSVLAKPEDRERLAETTLRETSTLGVRFYPVQRRVLARSSQEVETPFGAVRMKIAESGDSKKASPEYEDCRRLALERNVPFQEVYQQACFAYFEKNPKR